MKKGYHRRAFLNKSVILAGISFLTPYFSTSTPILKSTEEGNQDKELPVRINPAFRIYKLKDGGLELFTFTKPGSKITYQYSGLESTMILMILDNKTPIANLKGLASQFALNDSICKSKVDFAMDEFKKKGLIYYGDLMQVKITEVTYEQKISRNH